MMYTGEGTDTGVGLGRKRLVLDWHWFR